MNTFLLGENKEKRGVNKVLLAALAVAALLVAGGLYLLSLQPSTEEQKQKALEGFYLEGSPEFQKYTNNIIINTDTDRTSQSLTGLGTILMSIHADIRNKGDKTVNGLEVNVAVVDSLSKVIREKKVMVIPGHQAILQPNETMHVSVAIDGFSKEDDRANVRWRVTAIKFEK
ncbi:MAG: hypothetical protein ABR566_02920 [Pyrinomonadaceae bacterium]